MQVRKGGKGGKKGGKGDKGCKGDKGKKGGGLCENVLLLARTKKTDADASVK